uniref:Uncharacterized protein n=1 Tax=Magnetococcus massalia (strain MO-1) TaxID=451514 RepID=A0A1S7LGP6_MAGMO|nr:exported protein of unknown function [Candidatus Magnetococcus massalia]
MKILPKKHLLSVAAILGVTLGLYAVSDGFANGPNTWSGWGPGHMMTRGGHMGPMMGRGLMGPGRTGFAPMAHLGPAIMHGDDATVTAQLERLKAQLAITPEQTNVWNGYVEAIGTLRNVHQAMYGQMHSPDLTQEERIISHQTLMQEMIPARQALQQETQNLFQTLTETQRAQFRL